jgi:hypothetical protein
VGAVAAGEIRIVLTANPGLLPKDVVYVATVVNVLILAGAQWLLFRRQPLEVGWWIPATVAANLATAIVVIPTVLRLVEPAPGALITEASAVVGGAAALAAAGLVVGFAQAFVLRLAGGREALLWMPATVLGGALTGALTTALSTQFFNLRLPGLIALGLLTAIGSLMTAAAQAPILARLVR